jgi:hypothetical protein
MRLRCSQHAQLATRSSVFNLPGVQVPIHPTNKSVPPPLHADLAPLSLGKLTSLAEVEWVQHERERCPALRYYYLGFYIHTCHRMRYKVGGFALGGGHGWS